MRPLFFLFAAIIGLPVSCGLSPLRDQFRAELPAAPSRWTELLGEPHWRLEWYDSAGNLRSAELAGQSVAVDTLTQWPNAVLAWPYWPEKGLAAGMFYPAGALYPFDVRGESIVLSWAGGVDAYFYREMDKVRSLNPSNRTPEYFDWKRFRALLGGETLGDDLRADLWLADWKDIAEKTVRSGFRTSLVKAEKRIAVGIELPRDGPWIWSSPFRYPLLGEKDETVLLPLGRRPEFLVCPEGMLCVSQNNRLWAAWD
jgi:hypothetical protein